VNVVNRCECHEEAIKEQERRRWPGKASSDRGA